MRRGKGRGSPGRRKRGAQGKKGPPGRGSKGREARGLAASIVRGVLEGRGAARTHLERAAERAAEHGEDLRLGLLTELVYGTLRHLLTLDRLLDACAKKGLRKVEDQVLASLRVAAYQLLFLDDVPPAVAVSEAVRAAGQRAHVRGFVNGVLRQLERRVERKTRDDAPPLGVPSTRRLPGRDGGWVVLSDPLLPAAETEPAEWLSVAASLPLSLAQRWVESWGLEQALEVARAQNVPPPLCLRVNSLRTTRDELLGRLREAGRAATEGSRPESILLGEGLLAGGVDALWAGEATVQDETAMGVAPLLDPQPGERVVDLCAAPGGKTTHMAELMQDRGRVEALDVDPDRLARVDSAVRRLGLKSVRTTLVDPEDPRPPEDEAPVDRVLADVPCSNTGVLRRRVEVRWRLDRLDRRALLALQARLLDRAVDLVRPGGRVVYSTCAIDEDENQAQVAALLERRGDVALVSQHLTLPSRKGGDGGFAALLEVS